MKEKWMAISVTTEEALKCCIEQKAAVFCIEYPLYEKMKNIIFCMKELSDYELVEYQEKELFLFKRIHGENRFDEEKFVIYPYLLDEEKQ